MKESITYPLNAMQWETYEEWNQDRAMTEYNTTVAIEVPRTRVDTDNPDGEALYSSVGFRYFGENRWGGHLMKHSAISSMVSSISSHILSVTDSSRVFPVKQLSK